MLINEHVAVFTNKILLVPYSVHHVPKYHEWMKDSAIQEATASEPLTLDEEYDMQRSWRQDSDKLTFILCRPTFEVGNQRQGSLDLGSMIGDVNMFVSTHEDESGHESLVGELELMIAEKSEQRKGYGRSAILTFLTYILEHEGEIIAEYQTQQTKITQESAFDHFAVKIGQANERSIALFQSLGFHPTPEGPSYFGEIELRLKSLTKTAVKDMMNKFGVASYVEVEYILPD